VYVYADAVCWRRPIYAICMSYNTFQESLAAMARIFCADGIGGVLEAGAPEPAQHDAEGP
jgi:hypothetical protein